MIFKKLLMKNIRSYSHLEINFPRGSTLLSGNIGAGKTSILLALQFALFGLQPGQKGSSILRNGEDNAEVKLELEIDGKDIVIERSIKRSKNGSITQERNVLTVEGNQEEISTSEMKNKIISLLEYPKEFAKKSNLLYKFTVYTPQEEMKSIIQEKPDVRLDTLRHIFGIDRYKRIKENSQILIQQVKDSIKQKEFEVGEINSLRERLNSDSEKKITLTKETNNLFLELNSKIQEKGSAEEEVVKLGLVLEEKRKLDSEVLRKETELQGKEAIKSRLQREIFSMQNEIKENVDYSEENMKNIVLLLSKHKMILEELSQKLISVNSQISVLESKKERSFSTKRSVDSLENCPTCFQAVTHEHKDKISKKSQLDIEEVDVLLEPKFYERESILRDIDKEKILVRGYEEDKAQLEKNKIKAEHRRTIDTKIKSDSFFLERVIGEMNEIRLAIEEMRLKAKSFANSQILFDQKKLALDAQNREIRKIEISLAEKRKELELLKIRIEETTASLTRKESIRAKINYLRSLQDWLQEKFTAVIDATEKSVLAKLRNDFSKIINEWFTSLVDDSLSVRLDEDFTPIITNQDYEIDYDFLSGGERTAVALAYRLALNQILNSMMSNLKTKDIIILDEPTDGFSEQQLDKMRDIFEQLNSAQIILVSHEQKIEGFVDNIIKIQKDGTSKILEK
jgi:exonuclease SbcC